MKFIKCIPNRYPYNELLLNGKLSAKTRTWRWSHSGLVLLYTSKRSDKSVVDFYGLPVNHQDGVIVGYGYLKPVRLNTKKEYKQLYKQFGSGDIYPALCRYEFENLIRFKKPILFKPPWGAVSVFNVPFDLVKHELKK